MPEYRAHCQPASLRTALRQRLADDAAGLICCACGFRASLWPVVPSKGRGLLKRSPVLLRYLLGEGVPRKKIAAYRIDGGLVLGSVIIRLVKHDVSLKLRGL